MANHKWKDESFSKYNKEHRCVKCGLQRTWRGGDMQCWRYWYPSGHDKHSLRHIYKRPECE